MKDVIIPFMQKIGTMWITGIINPAQEHFITNMIRKKILVAIDGVVPEHNPNSKKFILYLPEGEQHEIPLLIAYYIPSKIPADILATRITDNNYFVLVIGLPSISPAFNIKYICTCIFLALYKSNFTV